MSDNVTTIIIAVLSSSVVLELIKALIAAIARATNKNSVYVKVSDLAPIKEGLMAIMQDRLERVMTTYLADGEMTANQFKSLETMVKAYEECDGDGFIHQLYDNCKDLPIK